MGNKGGYFEYNLPMTPPMHLHASILQSFNEVMHSIADRMDKLQEALDMSGMAGEVFSSVLKPIFDDDPDAFDELSAADIADIALVLGAKKTMPKRMVWPNADVVMDTDFVLTKEWEMVRRIGIGGSDSAIILGKSHFRSKLSLFYDKTAMPELIPQDHNNPVFKRGHILEDEVIGAFCDRTGAVRIRESRMFRSKTHPHCVADIDAIIRFPDGRLAIFEAKTTKAENLMSNWAAGKIPETYVSQCRHYPAVMNDDRITATYIGCLFVIDYLYRERYMGCDFDPCEFTSRTVERNKEEELSLLNAAEEFWAKYIESGVAPQPSGTNKDAVDHEIDDIMTYEIGPLDKALPPVEMNYEMYKERISEFVELQNRKRALTAAAEDIGTRMKQISGDFIRGLGNATVGHLDTGLGQLFVVRNTPAKKTTVDYDLMKDIYPQAYEDCVVIDPMGSRRFSLVEKKVKPTK